MILLLAPALLLWIAWCLHLGRVTSLASSRWRRVPLYLLVPASVSVLWWRIADRPGVLDVVSGGTLWLVLAPWLMPWQGLDPRDDVAERRNMSVGWVLAGALFGLSLGLGTLLSGRAAGDPFMEGVKAAALGAVLLAAIQFDWALIERTGNVSEAITVERDGGTALRLAGFLLASGWILGLALPWLVTSWPAARAQGVAWKGALTLGIALALPIVGCLLERKRAIAARPVSVPAWSDGAVAIGYVATAAAVATAVSA